MKKRILSIIAVTFLVLITLVLTTFASMEATTKFPEFKSKTSEGQDVTEAIFADKKLTMLNIWGTFCPPCIDEMPDLGKLGRTMPEGSQLIGLIIDVEDEETLELGKKILSESAADFLQILPVSDMNPYLQTVAAIPTTIFLDSQGNLVGEPLVGSRSEANYRAEVEKLLKLIP